MKKENNYPEKIRKVARLAEKLMPGLLYHNFNHAFRVFTVVSKLAKLEKIGPEDEFLLQTAALLHDVIYQSGGNNNEEKSSELAKEFLPKIGYTKTQTEKIINLILSTKLLTKPKNIIERIIKDADLDNLGREDFFEKGEKYRQELGVPKDLWMLNQLNFLEKHEYYTKSQRKLRNEGLQRNIRKLRKIVQEGTC